MSAALRIQLMLLARKNHFGKKSNPAERNSLHCHDSHHSAGAVDVEQTTALTGGGITTCEDLRNNGCNNAESVGDEPAGKSAVGRIEPQPVISSCSGKISN